MRVKEGKVVGGHIVTEAELLAEGAAATVLVAEKHTFTLSEADQAEVLNSIAEADRGGLLDTEALSSGSRRLADVAGKGYSPRRSRD